MKKARQDTGAWTPLRIVLLYALFGMLWIIFSDTIVLWFTADQATLSRLQTYKGWFFILVTAVLLFGLISRMVGNRHNILNELRRSEEYNRNLFTCTPIGLALCTMDGRLLDVNPAFAAILGRTVAETLSLSCWDITPEKYAKQEQAKLESLRAFGRYEPYEMEYIHKDGHLVAVRLQGRLIENNGEQAIWSSVEDITERIQAEAALRLSEEKFAKTFRNSPDAIALTALPDGQFVEVNERFLHLSGYVLEEVCGRTTLDLNLWVSLADRQRYIEMLQTQGRVTGMEVDFRKKNGEVINCLTSGEVIKVQGSSYILTVILDISDRREAEDALRKLNVELEQRIANRTETLEVQREELQKSRLALVNLVEDLSQKGRELEQANSKLQELDRLKSMFIASMSHELRTPLNSIIGFTGILLQGMAGPINDEQRDQLGRVYRAGKHLLSLITDVIDIAKIESGKIRAVVEEFPLDAVIDEACEILKVQMAAKGLALIKIVPATSIRMGSDRRRLLQCLLNYLSNAVKFSEKGTVTIEVKVLGTEARSAGGSDFVEISVSDTGLGIRQEDLPRLFKSFVRLGSSLKNIVPGTGLGLYLTKKLTTEVLGGEVAAESREGEGSKFTLRVPVCLRVAKEVEKEKAHR